MPVNPMEEAARVGRLFEYRKIGALFGRMRNVLQAQNRTLDFHVHETPDRLFYVIEGRWKSNLKVVGRVWPRGS